MRGLSVHRGISGSIWYTLAFGSVENISQCLLQLPKTPEGGLLCPQIEDSGSDTGNLPRTQWS